MSEIVPEGIPACAVNLLARGEWFADPGILARTRMAEANRFARFLSSPLFARAKITAITLGHTIHIRDVEAYNPHTPKGLALLAHEAKHVEQYEREGLLKFCAKYVWAYVFNGYGESVPFEGEAYEFERQVKAHLEDEFDGNPGHNPCQEMAEPHTPNDAFAKTTPEVFRFAV
jgi:hypothetical protein